MKVFLYFVLCFFSVFGFSQTDKFSIRNIDLNDDKPHFALFLNNNQSVLFTSYQLNKKGKIKKYLQNGILNIYEAKITDNGQLSEIKPLKIDESEDIWHITSACISPDGKTLFVTTNYTNRKNRPKETFKETNFHLEKAEYKEGVGWTNFEVLSFCKPRYSYAHPSLSPDGKTLYFTSNIRGGKETTKGTSDIFKVNLKNDLSFSEPENLGSKVNSYSGEMFPFLSYDGILYFASNRPNGVGGYDIYKSKMTENGDFEKARALPKPINSSKDDLCFVLDSQGEYGYFSSKRPEGKGEDDIYYFTFD
jgi:hypothetical protein